MPARPNVANVVKVELIGTVGPYNWVCVNHCSWSGTTPTGTALSALCADLVTAWDAGLKTLFNAETILGSIVMTDLTSNLGAQGSATPNQAGTGAGEFVAGNASVLITFPIGVRYRGGHPRMYLPPTTQNLMQDQGHWLTSVVTSFTTDYGTFQDVYYGSSSGGTTLAGQCAVSYVTALAPRVTPAVYPFTQAAFTVHTEIASQRRRIGRK